MAAEPEDPILDSEEEEGGPIKGFLEHLEDLRWVLLKSFTALFVALLVCLFGAPTLVGILKRPLEESGKITALYGSKEASIAVRVGTNSIGTFKPGNAYMQSLASLNIRSNQNVTLDLVPVTHGTNHYLAFTVNTNEAEFPQKTPVQLLNLTPAAGFMVALQVAFYGGLVFASPFILFFIAQFVLPALKVNELRYVRKAFLFCIALFLSGLCLCYYLMLPIALRAAVWFSNQMGFGAFQWTADTYIGFVTKFLLAMGIGFELPVFLLLFVKLGLINYSTLARNRKIVFVVILIVASILTPPDVVTQIAMTVPLYILFELTALIAWWWERKEKKIQAAEEAAEEAEREADRKRRNELIAAEAVEAEKKRLANPESAPAAQPALQEPSGDESSAKEEPQTPAPVEPDKEPFVPEGEPNKPYEPPLPENEVSSEESAATTASQEEEPAAEPDESYKLYQEALANSEEPAAPSQEPAAAVPSQEEQKLQETRRIESERNPDIPL